MENLSIFMRERNKLQGFMLKNCQIVWRIQIKMLLLQLCNTIGEILNCRKQ